MKTRLQIACLIGGLCLFFTSVRAQVSGSGRAYDFTSNYIDVPNSASLNSPTITLEAWIKADTWATNIWENVIISKDGWATGDQGYTLRCGANGSLSFLIGDGVPGWHEAASGPLMSTGIWYHVAGTYDGSVMRLFLNGNEIATTNYSGSISTTTYNVTIGKMSYAAGGGRYFDGQIDEPRIWNAAVPQSALRDYMCRKLTPVHPNYANLVGYWNFDVAGSVVDQSPQGNNGTVMGPTLVNSSAPIGNASAHSYGGTVNLTLPNGSVDSVQVISSSIFQTLHIYRVDGVPLVTNAVASLDSLDQNHYYGVFASTVGPYSYDLKYHYGSNPLLTGVQNYGKLASRLHGSAIPWLPTTIVHDIPNSVMTSTFTNRAEVRLAIDCPGIILSPVGPQIICEGNSLILQDNGQATLHQWYDLAGPISGATGNSLVVQNAGTYYVVANNGACATTSANISVTVNPLPSADFGTIPASFCENDLDFALTGIPQTGTYQGTGILGNTFSPSLAGAGNFSLTYTITDNNACSNADTVNVQVFGAPAVPNITQNGSDLCITPVAGAIYVWTLSGSVIPGATTNCYMPTSNGSYSVSVQNGAGCIAISSNFMLTDLSLQNPTLAHAILLSPNPSNTWIETKTSDENLQFSYTILDAQGRVSGKNDTKLAQHKIDVSALQSGMYYIHFQGNEGVSIQNFVVE